MPWCRRTRGWTRGSVSSETPKGLNQDCGASLFPGRGSGVSNCQWRRRHAGMEDRAGRRRHLGFDQLHPIPAPLEVEVTTRNPRQTWQRDTFNGPAIMSCIRRCELPQGALLAKYLRGGTYADCYVTEVARPVSHAEYVEAFYTTAVFKVERLLLAWLVSLACTLALPSSPSSTQGRGKQISAWLSVRCSAFTSSTPGCSCAQQVLVWRACGARSNEPRHDA